MPNILQTFKSNKITLAIIAVLLFIGIGGYFLSSSLNSQSPLKDPFRDSRLTLSDDDLGKIKKAVFSGNYKDFEDNSLYIMGLQITKTFSCQNFNPQQECLNFMMALDYLGSFTISSPEELQKDIKGNLAYLLGKDEVKQLQDEAMPRNEKRLAERDEIIALLKTGIKTENSAGNGRIDYKKTETNQAIDKIQGVIDRSDCQNVFFSTKFKRIKCETSMKTQPGCPSKIENSYTTTLQDLKLDSNITYGVIDCYTLMADNMLGRYVKLTDPDYNN